jgi:hypothetical protein
MLRLYESLGRPCNVVLSGKLLENASLFESNMLGQNPTQITNNSIYFTPFEIKTFLIK